jgi:site-specific recombinase XerD
VLTTQRRLKADLLPRLGARPVSEIKPRELVVMMKAIEEREASDVARRALQTASKIFRFAITNDLAERNPASEIRPSTATAWIGKQECHLSRECSGCIDEVWAEAYDFRLG